MPQKRIKRKELPSLELLLENVETDVNNLGRKKEEIEAIKREVTDQYIIAKKVRNTKRWNQLLPIVDQSGIPINTLDSWRLGHTLPKLITNYILSNTYIPKTDEEKKYFAYILGVLAYSQKPENRNRTSLERKIGNERMFTETSHAIELLLNQELEKDSVERIRITERGFLKRLFYTFEHEFDQYVANEEQRIAFLKGFFDTGKFSPSLNPGGNYLFAIGSRDKPTIEYLLETFFELGIYPYLNPEGHTLVILGKNNIARVCDLDLVYENKVKAQLLLNNESKKQQEVDPIIYKAILERVASLKQESQKVDYDAIGREFGYNAKTIKNWVREKKVKVPHIVTRYEILRDEITRIRNDRTLRRLKQEQIEATVIDEESQEAEDSALFSKGKTNKIPMVQYNGQNYTVSQKAMERYFTVYEIEPCYDADTLNHLVTQVTLALGGDSSRDLDITVNSNNVITGIAFKACLKYTSFL